MIRHPESLFSNLSLDPWTQLISSITLWTHHWRCLQCSHWNIYHLLKMCDATRTIHDLLCHFWSQMGVISYLRYNKSSHSIDILLHVPRTHPLWKWQWVIVCQSYKCHICRLFGSTNVISNHKLEHKQLTRNGERNNLAPFLLDCLCFCYWCCR